MEIKIKISKRTNQRYNKSIEIPTNKEIRIDHKINEIVIE